MTPEDFPRHFAEAFAKQDARAIARMLAEDVHFASLTGALAEDAEEAQTLLETEFAGIFASARLVTGKNRLRPLGPGGAILHQKFVVIGALDEAGQELPRFGALLTAVLLARAEGWRAVSLGFSALA